MNLATVRQRSRKRRASVKTARRALKVHEKLLANECESHLQDYWITLLDLNEYKASWGEFAWARVLVNCAVEIA